MVEERCRSGAGDRQGRASPTLDTLAMMRIAFGCVAGVVVIMGVLIPGGGITSRGDSERTG